MSYHPAKVRVTEYVRRRGSLDDLKLLVGVYRFRQVSRYFWSLIIEDFIDFIDFYICLDYSSNRKITWKYPEFLVWIAHKGKVCVNVHQYKYIVVAKYHTDIYNLCANACNFRQIYPNVLKSSWETVSSLFRRTELRQCENIIFSSKPYKCRRTKNINLQLSKTAL